MSRTPLRYPGGKQKITEFIDEIISFNDLNITEYVEPFAGGAGIAIALLLARKVKKIHLNDISLPIYAFWYSILNNTEEFCRKTSRTSLNIEEWKKQREILRNPNSYPLFDLGFATFYLNRCNRSGILSAGVIGGLTQSGVWKLDARFNRFDLIRRIESIALFKNSIKLKNMDAEKYITNYVPKLPKESLIYFDPPYYQKADSLYLNHYLHNDHSRIAKIIQSKVKHPWVVSYDFHKEIKEFYNKRKKILYSLQYHASKSYKGREIFIFSDKLSVPNKSKLEFINSSLNKSMV
ncbi:DNA adenine methylase [Leptospira terpstrae]|uniref:site-specific DNA-methyltransferase (adenine-specific) n=1 Tax=Leptospira terpstrae serovar Hualin str. LT 11-33 = ATCC 700639 TaxID=1257025 RepID=N1VQD8_9LEPT|nr:DNA adenine methylase [Leptospira terpstrae]EMY60663.1 D12 class N6 adenine-specific DNA methyltransferase [Leptospira terpstrae serovar Hualin str. LT 11-33 = ATCC 700639]